ncbi:MAG: hypothetical protein AAF798_00305 [Bacteroidota bacterium]
MITRTLTLLFLFFFLSSHIITTQQEQNIWRTLSTVQLEKQYDEMIGMELITPNFGPKIRALEGKEVIVKGYIIPSSGKVSQEHFMFSSLPYSMCFFCGKAGPESAMEVFTKKGANIKYSEEAVLLRGTLRLLDGGLSGLIYSLDDAEVVD